MTAFFSLLPRKTPLSCAVFQRQRVYIEYKYLILSALSFWSSSVYNVTDISLQDGKISQWHQYETQSGVKKYWTMVFNRIAVHIQKFGQIRATSKNGLKFDIGRLCSQPFNYYVDFLEMALTMKAVKFTILNPINVLKSLSLMPKCTPSQLPCFNVVLRVRLSSTLIGDLKFIISILK